jgi:tRNA threonylcarbamoyladenosine biosynthesis protein TsaB
VLLAFDTATPRVTVAIADGATVLAEHRSEETMRHGEQLAPLIEQTLADAGVDRSALSAIAVGVGPGPFTGLRVGLVTARTLGYVLDVPVHGVCTLDVLAAEAVASGTVDAPFTVATDARRKEVYLASYDGSGRRLAGPEVARPDDVATGWPVVGPGAELYPHAFPHGRAPLLPSAGWLARVVATTLAEGGTPLPPEPLYLRRPDAAERHRPKPVS